MLLGGGRKGRRRPRRRRRGLCRCHIRPRLARLANQGAARLPALPQGLQQTGGRAPAAAGKRRQALRRLQGAAYMLHDMSKLQAGHGAQARCPARVLAHGAPRGPRGAHKRAACTPVYGECTCRPKFGCYPEADLAAAACARAAQVEEAVGGAARMHALLVNSNNGSDPRFSRPARSSEHSSSVEAPSPARTRAPSLLPAVPATPRCA